MADSMDNIVIQDGQVMFKQAEEQAPPANQDAEFNDIQEDQTTSEEQADETYEEEFYTPEEVRQLDFEKLDPKRLPPELIPYYKSMQADYTRKTQTLAERRREVEQLAHSFNQPRQEQEPPKQSQGMKEFYAQLNNAAKQMAEESLGEQLKLVDEYGEPNYVHQAAYNDAIANIKIKLYEKQMEEQSNRRVQSAVEQTISRHQQDPDWNEISQFAVKMLNSMPYEKATELQTRFRQGDIQTIDRYLTVVKEEYEKIKYPQLRNKQAQSQNKMAPPGIESANAAHKPVTPDLDMSKLGSMTNEQQTTFLREWMRSKK